MHPILGKALLQLFTSRRSKKFAVVGVLFGLVVPLVFLAGPVVLMLALTGAVSGGSAAANPPPDCDDPWVAPDLDIDIGGLSDEQIENAATIVGEGQEAGVPEYGWVIALATAMQESTLRNLDHGDRDSLGLFQQRPSTGWGNPAQVRDPELSSQAFFGTAEHTENPGLLDIDGWESMSVTDAAQAVQRSAYPHAYAQWEGLARALVVEIGGGSGQDQCGDGDGLACPQTGRPEEEGLTPDALRVIRCLDDTFAELETFHGVGEREANPDSDHPSGRAVDAMIPDWESPTGIALGWRVAEWVRTNAAGLGVRYIIFGGKIWSAEKGDEDWREYDHPSGAQDPTAEHLDHVHVSVYGDAADDGGGEIGSVALPIDAGDYRLTARFGDCGPRWQKCHTGLDFAAPERTPVKSIADGTVASVGDGGAYGIVVKVSHADDTESWYTHMPGLASVPVREGDSVRGGQVIGAVGMTGNTTGPHLHLEVRERGTPIDPEKWLSARGVDP